MARRLGILVALLACAGVLVYVERAPEKPLALQPFPDSIEYASSARSLALGDGFYTHAFDNAREPPEYPPGYPMALAPFATVGSYPLDVQRGAKFWALFYVLVALVAAWVLGGAGAATVMAGLIAVSPFARDAAGIVMSDVYVGALTVLMLPLLRFSTKNGTRLAGAATGLAVLARITAGVNLLVLLIAAPRRSYRTIVIWALPSLVGLALLQWIFYGSPFTTGYSYWGVMTNWFRPLFLWSNSAVVHEGSAIFAARFQTDLFSWVCPCQVGGPQASLPNIFFYPLLLAGGFWVFSPPLVSLFGLFYAWRHRSEPVGRFALALVALSLLLFDFYFYQGTRFMVGPATVLTVLASVWLSEGAGHLARWLAPRAGALRPRRSIASPRPP